MTLQQIINTLDAAATEEHDRDAIDEPEGTLTCTLSLTLVRELRNSLKIMQGELNETDRTLIQARKEAVEIQKFLSELFCKEP